jgi:hypothetical protein
MTPTYNAIGPRGNVLASFSSLDLAERYKADRSTLGVEITIRRVVLQSRAA